MIPKTNVAWSYFQTRCHPMPILGRWDGSDDDDGAPPARVSAGAWRYDETDSGESDSKSGEDSSGLLGFSHGFVGNWLLAKKKLHYFILFFGIWIWQLMDPSSYSDEDGIGWAGETSEVNLKLSMLESFHQHHDADGPRDFYAKNGASSSRLRRLLQHPPCSCGCTLPFNVLRKCCQSFWSLPKQLQDSVLWSLQCGSGRKTWSIEGLDIFQICSNLSFDCLVVFSLVFFLASRTSTLPTVLVEVSGDWQAKDRPYKAQIQGGRWANFEPRTLYPIYFVCFGLWFFSFPSSINHLIPLSIELCVRSFYTWSKANCISNGFLHAYVLVGWWINGNKVSCLFPGMVLLFPQQVENHFVHIEFVFSFLQQHKVWVNRDCHALAIGWAAERGPSPSFGGPWIVGAKPSDPSWWRCCKVTIAWAAPW